MAGALITDDFQVEFNGLLFGGADADSRYEIATSNMFDLPTLRTSDVNRPQRDGQFAGTDFMAGKTITIQGEAWSSGVTDMGTRLNALMAVFSPGVEADLVTQVPQLGKIRLPMRVRRRSIPLNQDQTFGLIKFTVELYAVDPVWTSNDTKATVVGLTNVSGGMSFPLTFPLSFGETNIGSVNMENEGTYESYPLIIIAGPITNPSLENRSVGKTITFNGTLATGENLYVDFNARTVLLNNGVSRYNWVDDPKNFWALQPGTNDLWLGGTAGAGTPVALPVWRDAWV